MPHGQIGAAEQGGAQAQGRGWDQVTWLGSRAGLIIPLKSGRILRSTLQGPEPLD